MARSIAQTRIVVLGCVSLMMAFQIVVVGQASALESAQSFGRLAELVPAFLQRGLGGQSMLLATFKGTVALGYFHPVIAILISVLAISFVTQLAYEVESGLVDVTLARAVPRHVIVTRSVILAAGAATLAATLMGLGTTIGLRLFASPSFDSPSAETSAWMLLHLTAVAMCFAGFALALASGSRRWSTAFTISALTVVVMYLLDFLALGWRPLRSIAWISPFNYYPALSILAGTAPPWRNLVVLLSASAIFIAIGYWRFNRRDL
jgi:putative exporter of polyketide antibiotics